MESIRLGNPEEKHNLGEKKDKEMEQVQNLMGTNPGNLEEKHNLGEKEVVSAECNSCKEGDKRIRVKEEVLE